MEFRIENLASTARTQTSGGSSSRPTELNFEGIRFDASRFQEIDSDKYSMFDLTQNEQIDAISFSARAAMVDSWVDDMRQKGYYLYRRELLSGCKPLSTVADNLTGEFRQMINLGSNDYLNLSQHPRVLNAAIASIRAYGIGSGSAPLFSGTMRIHRQLEQQLAALKGCDDAITFTSGYAANSGTISALLRKNDVAIYDRYCHASLFDGSVAGNRLIYSHNDMKSLEFVLRKAENRFVNKLIILDGVYSMDGDIAKLDEIVELAHHYGAWVMVDDAHATGVIGKTGKGTMEHFNLEGKVDIVSGTLSKTLGGIGGYIAGSDKLVNLVKNTARSFIFSSSGPVMAAAAALESIKIIQEEPELRTKLWENIHYLRSNLISLGFDLGNSETAILPLVLGDDYKVKEMALRLDKAGIFVNSVPYPAVPRRLSRVRISVTAGLSREDLDRVIVEISRIGKDLSIIN